MRVAFVCVHGCPTAPFGSKDTGGMNVLLRETARSLGEHGIDVDIYTRTHDLRDPQIVHIGERARVIHLQAGPVETPKRELTAHLPEFTDRLISYADLHGLRYDVVHAHYWLSGIVAIELRRRWGTPIAASFHTLGKVQDTVRLAEPDAAERIPAEERLVAQADAVIAGSPHEVEQLGKLYGASSSKTSVISWGVDIALFKPISQRDARDSLGLNGNKIVLFVGRMEPIKGVDVLLYAMAGIDKSIDSQLIVVGGDDDDQERMRLRQIAKGLGIEKRMTFLDAVPQRDLPLYYSAADVCVVPSFYETFGLVALEAMACGTPVIAAKVGGLQNTIIDGKTGYLIPWHCPEPYTECLEVVLSNDHLRKSLGNSARESVEGLSWGATAEQLANVYRSLAKTAAAR